MPTVTVDRTAILRNCTASSGYQGDGVTNISASRLVDLLIQYTSARGELGRACRSLLREMEASFWDIRAGVHEGGLGGGGRGADPRAHITLRVAGNTYHLRFGGSGTTLIEITG